MTTANEPTETPMSFADVCAEIRALLADIPRERWVWTCNEGDLATLSKLSHETLSRGVVDALHGVALDNDELQKTGNATMVCFTGNGPNSQKHARLLMLVRAVLPELLDRAQAAGPT